MKKLYIVTLSAAIALSLHACAASEVEKEPVTVSEEAESDDQAAITEGVKATEITSAFTPTKAPEEETTDTSVSQKTIVSDPYTSTIQIEGTEEQITCRTLESPLGFLISYDVDRFSVTEEESFVSFMAENTDPELYPYVYLNIYKASFQEENEDGWSSIEIPEANISGYVNKDEIKIDLDDYNEQAGLKSSVHLKYELSDPVKIGEYDAIHYKAVEGSEWNSIVSHYYFIVKDESVYVLATQYFLEAEEGYGARFQAMMDTFNIIE